MTRKLTNLAIVAVIAFGFATNASAQNRKLNFISQTRPIPGAAPMGTHANARGVVGPARSFNQGLPLRDSMSPSRTQGSFHTPTRNVPGFQPAARRPQPMNTLRNQNNDRYNTIFQRGSAASRGPVPGERYNTIFNPQARTQQYNYQPTYQQQQLQKSINDFANALRQVRQQRQNQQRYYQPPQSYYQQPRTYYRSR